jgi:hypothetical protein
MSESYGRDSAHRRAGALASSIAIVSPISTATWRPAFVIGVNNANIALTWDDQDSTTGKPYGYGTKKNYTALSDAIANHDGKVGLIVTTGGNIAFRAAVDAGLKTTPFISLVGEFPARRPDNFYGGVALQSWQANDGRINFLLGKGYKPSDIGLFCNRRSAMHGDETTLWHGSEYYMTGGGGKNDPTAFTNEFNNVDDSIQALIISADPFFQDTKATLIAACNNWVNGKAGRSVCYPLQDYATVPMPANTYWYGPSLTTAYTLLGQAAAKVLQNGTPVPFSFTADGSGP